MLDTVDIPFPEIFVMVPLPLLITDDPSEKTNGWPTGILAVVVFPFIASKTLTSTKGLEITVHIRDNERGAKAVVTILEEGKESEEFWQALGGKGTNRRADRVGSTG